MKKRRWIKVLLTLVLPLTVLIIFLANGGCERMLGYPSKEVMIEILETQEAKDVLIKRLRTLDKNALTDKGVIKTYAIDYDSIEWNPLGGIMFDIYINNNRKWIIGEIMNKYNGTLELGIQGISKEVDEFLEGESYE